MSNHNKIRPLDKNNPNGKYKILFSSPQSKKSNIPMEFRGLQIFNTKSQAEEALKKRKQLTKILEEKRAKSMIGNNRAIGNSGGDLSNLVQFNSEVQKLKKAKITRAKQLYKEGFQKSEILRKIIMEFNLNRDLRSRSWPKWLSDL